MGTIWFTADTHFAHKAIISHCHRPFGSIDEMDDQILLAINQRVKENDVLYHLGDFAFRRPEKYRAAIRCKSVHLVFGNHDKTSDGKLFLSAQHSIYLRHAGRRLFLSHYPMTSWRNSHHGCILLHGHCHGTHNAWKQAHMPNALSWDIGVDTNLFEPISLETILDRADAKIAAGLSGFVCDHHQERSAV